MATQVYPVCGMQVDERTAAGQSDDEGRTYYFAARDAKRSSTKTRSGTRRPSKEGQAGAPASQVSHGDVTRGRLNRHPRVTTSV